MNGWDIAAIITYFAVVLGAGFWYRKRAAENLQAYFLGGKRIPWVLLAMSGSVSNFDITGTMWMVSVLLILGMKSWWHHWMWGVTLPAFALAFMASWVRRSGVMTAAEWMRTRFGTDEGGALARYASAIMSVIFTAAAVGYAFQGIGKFTVVYLPLESLRPYLPFGADWIVENQEAVLASSIFTLTTLYVVLGGLYSVVLTDVIQTVILTLAGILIAGIAYVEVSPEVLAGVLPQGFADLTPVWRLEEFAGTDNAVYEMFGLLMIVWVLKGLLMNAGGPGQLYDFQRYLAARDARDASKVAAAWPFFLVVRWAMVMGIALLALTGLLETTDPERVMPEVLHRYLPAGLRGLVIAGLLAAFMSTFSSTVNAGASFVVRDLWQPLFAPHADERHLIRYSYLATVGIVLAGIIIGYQVGRYPRSIALIWNWMMMALMGGIIIPNLLRWYWWRLNGWGYAMGVFGGIALSMSALFLPDLPIYWVFPSICLGSAAGCIIGSLATEPTRFSVLAQFHRSVKPFGAWGPVRRWIAESEREAFTGEREGATPLGVFRIVGNTLLAIAAITGLYLAPMYLVAHFRGAALMWLGVVVAAASVLYFTWYRHLPPPGEGSD